MNIRPFARHDHNEVVKLWELCDLVVPWNNPGKDIRRKIDEQPQMLLVCDEQDAPPVAGNAAVTPGPGRIIGTVMVGYDGHRGWINYLAVHPERRRTGLGRRLMEEAERLLRLRGCPKINLQVRRSNTDVVAFYESIGFKIDDVLSMGKRLENDLPGEAVELKPDGPVFLREITPETVRTICALSVADGQHTFVARNALSLAEASVAPHAWFRAIYLRETPIGFLMLHDDPEKPEYFLWRFMIDHRFQREGYGREAMKLLIDHVRSRPGATELLTSCVQADGGPQPFYEGLGFRPTGEYEDGEVVLRLAL